MATDVTTEYEARGRGAAVDIRARLEASVVSGALVGAGSRVEVATTGTAVRYAIDANLNRLNLKRVGEDWHVPSLVRPWADTDLAVQVRGQASARDWTNAVDGAATAVVSDAPLFGGRISALTLTGEVRDDTLHVVADGAFAGVDPRAGGAPQALAGSLAGRLNLDGTIPNVSRGITLDAVAASAAVTLEPSSIGGVDIASGVLDGSLDNQTADIRRFELTGPAVAASAHGTVAFGASGASDLVLHAESGRLDAIAAAAGQPIRGIAALDATVSGSRPQLQIAGTLTGGNLAARGIGALTLATSFSGIVPEFRIADATLDASTQATFASLGGWQVNELTATTRYAARQLEFDAVARQPGREMAAAGSVDVRADRQQLRLGRLDVRAGNHEWQTAPGVVATAQYGGGRVEIHGFTLASGAQHLTVEGALGRDGDALSLTIDGADLAAVEALLLRPPQFAGTLDASATVTGTVARPQVAAQFQVDRGAFRGFRYDRFGGSAAYDGSAITVDTTLAQNASAHVTARGRLPVALFTAAPGGTAPGNTQGPGLSAGGQLDLHIDTTPIDLGIVQGLTSQVTNVKGTLEAHVDVTGSAADPHPTGAITVSNGAFVIPATGVPYSNLRGTVEFRADGIHIANVSVLDNQQSALSLSGDLAMHERQVDRVQLYLTAEDFKVIDNKMGSVRVNSSLEVAGDLRAPRVSGEFGVSTGTVNLDPILAALGDSPYPTSPTVDVDVVGPGAVAQPRSFADALQLDVHITAPNDLVVKASDVRPGGAPIGLGAMNVTVGGDLRATKAPARQVRLLGTVTMVRGFYDFQGRRFDILRDSSVRFDGGWQSRPALDIRAERIIQGVTAHVNLRGTLDKP
ncbi:MAG: translocation/assembly module TamB domain-containing protein, partial [Verrucomicrobiota bacterium]